MNAVDELLKAPEDNPTIGLLICSNMDSTDVQWSFRGLGTPMGIATYNNIRIKDALPSKELLEERMRLLQKEMHTSEAENAIRHVQICPLYAISQIK